MNLEKTKATTNRLEILVRDRFTGSFRANEKCAIIRAQSKEVRLMKWGAFKEITMKSWTRRISFALVAAVAVLWFSGCLSTNYLVMLRYDDAKDEFHVLNVYQRIAAATPGDSEYLYQLWLNRDHLIRVPNVDIFTMPAYVRMSPAKYAAINLGEAPPILESADTPISLGQIRVLPGTFFLRGPDTLCYYDQVVLPGKVVDQALPVLIATVAPKVIEGIDKELQRRKDGGKRVGWGGVRRYIEEGVHASANPTTTPATQPAEELPSPDAVQILDEESLGLLRKGVTDGGVKLTREKQVFHLIVPLSNADARQCEDSWHIFVDALKKDAPKAAAGTQLAVVSKLQPAFDLKTLPNAVELEINLAIIIDRLPELASITEPLGDPAPEKLASMRDTIKALRAHGVPIDEKLTVEQLAKDFVTDSVNSYASAHPVEPGSGLVQTPPAKP